MPTLSTLTRVPVSNRTCEIKLTALSKLFLSSSVPFYHLFAVLSLDDVVDTLPDLSHVLSRNSDGLLDCGACGSVGRVS